MCMKVNSVLSGVSSIELDVLVHGQQGGVTESIGFSISFPNYTSNYCKSSVAMQEHPSVDSKPG